MLRALLVLAALVAPVAAPLPGATAFRVCGGEGIPYPQEALAAGLGSVWGACGPRNEVRRYDARTGRLTARVPAGLHAWSVAAGEGGVWTLARDVPTVVRIDPRRNRVAARIRLDRPGVGLWVAAGAVWVADDTLGAVVRIDPATNRVAATVSVGDGPSGVAFDGASLWVVCHRDNSLWRVDPATNTASRVGGRLAAPERTAAEHVAALAGSLWITGRGLDLLRVSPDTGAIVGRSDVGPAGLALVPAGTGLDVIAYTPTGARRGDPVAGAVLRVGRAGAVTRRRTAKRRLFANGVAASGGRLWVLDSVDGLLLRLPA